MLSLLLLTPLADKCGGTCRYMQMQAKLGNLNSPPPPPPLDMWDKHYVARWMSHDPQLVGINTTAFHAMAPAPPPPPPPEPSPPPSPGAPKAMAEATL